MPKTPYINDPGSVFRKVNEVFQRLPLAAVVENQILCINGGLGRRFQYLDQLEELDRPLNYWSENG